MNRKFTQIEINRHKAFVKPGGHQVDKQKFKSPNWKDYGALMFAVQKDISRDKLKIDSRYVISLDINPLRKLFCVW